MNGKLNELAREIHQNAVDHGWWDEERSFPEIVALCHSELSEALEEDRNEMPAIYFDCKSPVTCSIPYGDIEDCKEMHCKDLKPSGTAVEMADCIIRILDWCGRNKIDIEKAIMQKHEFNKGRPYKHGGKAY